MGLEDEGDGSVSIEGIARRASKYEVITPLFREMKICAEYCGCWHWEFLRQSKEEKLKWYLYEQMVRERESYFNRRREEQMKAKPKAVRARSR